MSIWASIEGEDPIAYYDGDPDGDSTDFDWFDVAVSTVSDRVRVLVFGDGVGSEIILDSRGLSELHRRIFIARERMANNRN